MGTEAGTHLTELRPHCLLTCSRGWTSEFPQRRAADSAAELHPKIAAAGVAHTITTEEPAG